MAAAAVGFVWLVLALGLRIAYSGEVLPGTRMSGVSLGGASEAEARRRLNSAPGNVVTLTHGKYAVPIEGQAVGLDLQASVDRAMSAGRSGSLGGLWSSVVSLLSHRVLRPVYRSHRAALPAVAAAARNVDRPPFFGALSIDPETLRVTATPPRRGVAVDRRRTAATLMAALGRGHGGDVPMAVRVRPAVAPSEVQAVRARAERYLTSGLRLESSRQVVEVTPRQLASILALETVDDAARPQVRLGVRREALARLVEEIAAGRRRAPVDAKPLVSAPTQRLAEKLDATWTPRRANVRVHPSRAGATVPTEAAVAAIARAVREGRHRARLLLRTLRPGLSTADARRITSLIGTFTTSFPCCQPRVTNIRLIAEAVDGTIVARGERFSLNAVAERRTRAKGYVEAPFIADGKLVPSVGGGVSQMSTTMYNAAFFAGLQIDSRTPHSFYIDRYPPGREATLDYPSIDLTWTNDTQAPVLVRATSTPTSVSVDLYGDNGGRRVRALSGRRQPVPGRDFAVTTTRRITYPGGRVTSEHYTTTYDRPPPP